MGPAQGKWGQAGTVKPEKAGKAAGNAALQPGGCGPGQLGPISLLLCPALVSEARLLPFLHVCLHTSGCSLPALGRLWWPPALPVRHLPTHSHPSAACLPGLTTPTQGRASE